MDISNADVLALFTNIAETHPAILHQPSANPPLNRFWGFDPNQLISGTGSQFNWDNLLLGLSSTEKGNLNWDYADVGTATYKGKYISLHIIAKYETGVFADQETKAQACEQCMEDILTWLINTANGSNQDAWPVVQLMELKRVPVRRVNNIGVANCTGAIATIQLRAPVGYSNTNPLNGMTP